MAQLGQTFDAHNVDPKESFDAIPLGLYPNDMAPVMIVASEMRENNAKTGQYLWLELDVVDGPAKGRKLWDRLNLINPNAKAVEIAERTLSAICHAVGVMNVSDSEQLHGRVMLAKYKIKPADGQYPASNEIGTYKPVTEQAQATAPAPAATAAPAQAAQAAPAPAVAPPPAAAPAAANPAPPWRQ